MKAILEAIRVQYPPGMSVTGIPNSKFASSRRHGAQRQKQGGKPGRRQAWHVNYETEYADEAGYDEHQEVYLSDTNHDDAAAADETHGNEYDDVEYDVEDNEAAAEQDAPAADGDASSDLAAVMEALTVTSRRLAEITKARGFYQDKTKGKSGGKASNPKGKGKSKTTEKGKSKGKGKPGPMPNRHNLAMQGKALDESLCLGCGKPGHWLRECPNVNTYQAQLTTVRTTLDVYGMVDHSSSWMVTCTKGSDDAVVDTSVTAGKELTASMSSSGDLYMTESMSVPTVSEISAFDMLAEPIDISKNSKVSEFDMLFDPIGISQNFKVPAFDMLFGSTAVSKNFEVSEFAMLHEGSDVFDPIDIIKYSKVHEVDMSGFECFTVHEHDVPHGDSYTLYGNPQILLQTVSDVEGGMMIADTGCQRQVAGQRWHEVRCKSIEPLQPLKFHDSCSFSFGPHKGTPAVVRHAYPAGLGGVVVALGISEVSCEAPALFSRPAFEILGAVPDIGQGVMYYRALNTTSKLFLASGHLAIGVDEWPEDVFDWPFRFGFGNSMPDVVIPDAVPLKSNKLDVAREPVRRPPHASEPSASNAVMASELEVPDGKLHGEPGRRADHGAELCSHFHAPEDQGRDPGALLSTSDGRDDVEDGHSSHDAEDSAELPQRPGQLSASKRAGSLRRWRPKSAHLRSMWPAMGGKPGQGQVPAAVCTQGVTNSQDATGFPQDGGAPLPQSQEQADIRHIINRGVPKNGLGYLGKFLGWCTALAVALSDGSDLTPTEAWRSTTSRRMAPLAQEEELTLGENEVYIWQPRQAGIPTYPLDQTDEFAEEEVEDHLEEISDEELQPIIEAQCAEPVWLCRQASAEGRPRMDAFASRTTKAASGNYNVRQCLMTEAKVYQHQAERARALRHHRCDLVEIYGGFANISAEGLQQGLRVLQPIDKVHGINIESKSDHQQLRRLLHQHRPFLTVWEIRCDPWSRIQHLNYDHDELEELRQQHRLALREMAETIVELYYLGCHFPLENPWGTDFWQQAELQLVLALPGVQLKKGSMCNFGLRGGDGQLLRKDTGWASDPPEILNEVVIPCPGNHEHELCLGSNARRAQVYTKKLARAVVKGFLRALQRCGDERCLRHVENYDNWVSSASSTPMTSSVPSWTSWTSTTTSTSWYVDVSRDVEAWRPLLKEAHARLHNKVQASATVRPDTAYYEQIRQLAPWKLKLVQITTAPKVRRLPTQLMMKEAVTHRAAILQYETGHITIETEPIEPEMNAGKKFDEAIAYGTLLYGEAPASSFDPAENSKPEESRPKKAQKMSAEDADPDFSKLDPEEHWDHQLGAGDVIFPGLHSGVLKWIRSVLNRVHVNLGHPGREALVRHLAQAGAGGEALLAAKHLRCRVCERTKAPPPARPAKVFQARRFNDRLMMDLVFVRDVTSELHTFLSQVDDGTTYHVMDRLDSRSSEEVAQVLTRGWFKYFGYPDEMLLDAEGAMRGWDFEIICAQAGVKIRFVPPDAHYQIGKAERHGQAVKQIMWKLVSQFAATTAEELQQLANMACFAKNTMARRSGASPCQWVYGRAPKIPTATLSEPDALEAKQVINDSERLRRIEEQHLQAMLAYLQFEHSEALRKAILRKSRPWRGPIEIGAWVAYYRQKSQLDGDGTAEGYRQGIVIGVDPSPTGSVWIRNNRVRLVQVAREQICGVEGVELWTPSMDDLKMLKTAEDDLSKKFGGSYDHRGPAPRQIEDRLVLDASGDPQAPDADGPPLLMPMLQLKDAQADQPAAEPAMPATPVPATPRTRRQKQLADAPAAARTPKQQRTETIAAPSTPLPAEQPDLQAGWFLDPDGRPTVVTENALTIPVPDANQFPLPEPQQDSKGFCYRSSWSMQDGIWRKLEDRVAWSEVGARNIATDGRPVERLVTSFSPDQDKGRRPSIQSTAETQRGVKRDADQSGLPPREERPPDMSDAAQPSASVDPPAEQPQHAEALPVYCEECGCADQQQDLEFSQCTRCSLHSFVTDPRQVTNWFDEVEERKALQQLQDLTYDFQTKHWSSYPRAAVQETTLPARDTMDDIHDNEAFCPGRGASLPTTTGRCSSRPSSGLERSNQRERHLRLALAVTV